MSTKTPQIPLISNPKGLEKHIQLMQQRIDTELTWLDYVFGLAEWGTEDVDGRTIIRPEIYQGLKADKYVLFPNDYLKSYCFFYITGSIDLNYGEGAGPGRYSKNKANLSIVFWVNLSRIENIDYRLTKSKLRIDIQNMVARKFREDSWFVPERTFENRMDEIFEGFTVDHLREYPIVRHPYWGLRVEGVLHFNEACYTLNTYTR